MKLSEWAKKQGITYRTAWKWFNEKKLPVDAYQTETGTIIINEECHSNKNNEIIVIYCRVSSRDRKLDLERQVERCLEYCRAKGFEVFKIYKEIASGMNDSRKELLNMLDSKPDKIVIENKDRLTRFGFNYLEILLNQRNCKIEVLNRDFSDESDLIKDLISIITSFCCRIYGMRRGYNKAKKIEKEIIDNK